MINPTKIIPPIFVVNLDRAIDRREFIVRQLNSLGLAHTIISAVDGRQLTKRELKIHYDEAGAILRQSRPLTRSEIGCALSHISIYQEIQKRGIDKALILEDDCIIPNDFADLVCSLSENVDSQRAEVFLLSDYESVGAVHSQLGSGREVRKLVKGYFTSSYIVTRAGAETLAHHLYPVKDVADCWGRLQRFGIVTVYAVHPPVTKQNRAEFTSTTVPEIHQYFRQKWSNRIKYKLRRVRSIIWDMTMVAKLRLERTLRTQGKSER